MERKKNIPFQQHKGWTLSTDRVQCKWRRHSKYEIQLSAHKTKNQLHTYFHKMYTNSGQWLLNKNDAIETEIQTEIISICFCHSHSHNTSFNRFRQISSCRLLIIIYHCDPSSIDSLFPTKSISPFFINSVELWDSLIEI